MALPIINGVVRASFTGGVVGSVWANVWHFRYAAGASTPGSTEIDALHALVPRIYSGAAFGAGQPWFNWCKETVTLTGVTYMPLDGVSLPYPKTLSFSGGAGAGAASLPSNAAYVVTNRTAFRGRSRRGRNYLPSPVESATDVNGYLEAGTQNAMIAQLEGLRTALGGHQAVPISPFWEVGVASYKLGTFFPTAMFTMDGRMDHQDGRKS